MLVTVTICPAVPQSIWGASTSSLLCWQLSSLLQCYSYLATDLLTAQHKLIWLFHCPTPLQCNVKAVLWLAPHSGTYFQTICNLSFLYLCFTCNKVVVNLVSDPFEPCISYKWNLSFEPRIFGQWLRVENHSIRLLSCTDRSGAHLMSFL